jgi:hypothetical protein
MALKANMAMFGGGEDGASPRKVRRGVAMDGSADGAACSPVARPACRAVSLSVCHSLSLSLCVCVSVCLSVILSVCLSVHVTPPPPCEA